MKRLICLFLVLILLVGIAGNAWLNAGKFLSGQVSVGNRGVMADAETLDALREYNDGIVPDISTREDGTPYVIYGSYSNSKVTDEESAVASMSDLSDLMGFSDANDSFESTQVNHVDGNVYYRLQRYYGQYPVYGQDFVVTTDAEGNIMSLSSAYARITTCADDILIPEEQAKAVALEHCGGSFDKGTLMFYLPDGSSSARLAWQFSGLDVVFVDAGNGEILTSFPAVYTAYYEAVGTGIPDEDTYREVDINLARDDHDTTDSSDDTFLFYDHSRNTYYYDARRQELDMGAYRETCDLFTGDDDVFGDASENEKKAVSLYENLSVVYDAYKEHVGITSYDNNGGMIIALVNEQSYNGYNAFSSYPGLRYDQMTTFLAFGSNETFHKQIDVVGHEFTHSVQTSLVPQLNYSGQTGALMEAYSDVMGELLEIYRTGSGDWYHSDSRNLAEPAQSETGLPSVYQGEYWDAEGEVHHNSTVMSHALYKMYSRGLCSAEDMAKFLYKAWQHMTPTGDFQQYSNCLFLAAAEMRMKQEQREIIRTALQEAGIQNDRKVNITFRIQDSITKGSLKLKNGSDVNNIFVGLNLNYALTEENIKIIPTELVTNIYLNDNEDSFQTFDYTFAYGLWDVSILAKGYELKRFTLVVDDTTERRRIIEMDPNYAEKDDTPDTGSELDDNVYLEYLKSGAYRTVFDNDPTEGTYEYALVDVDRNGLRELLIRKKEDPYYGWMKLAVLQYDSTAKDFAALPWGPGGINTPEGENITYAYGGIAYSEKYKSLVFDPMNDGQVIDQREFWCLDGDQMNLCMYLGKDHSDENDKHWAIHTPQEDWKRITEAEWNAYVKEPEEISFAAVPESTEHVTEVAVYFEYKNDYEKGKEYGVFVAKESGKEIWRYTTVEHVYTDLRGFGEIGIANGIYYLYDDGNVITLDLQTGKEVWRCPFIGGSASFDFDNVGTLYICGHYGPDLAVIDKEGKMLKQIDSFDTNYYWADGIDCQQDKVIVKLSGGPDGYKEKGYTCMVFLPDCSYRITE